MTSLRTASAVGARRALAVLVVLLTTALTGTVSAPSSSAAVGCPPAGGVRVPTAPAPVGADFVVDGHGWGHGLGMSQYGAQGAALLGCSASTILTTYYPGLRTATKPLAGRVLVQMLDTGGDRGRAEVTAESGPVTWRSGSRTAVQPRGATWTVRRSGSGALVQSGTAAAAPRVAALDTPSGVHLRAEHSGVVTRTATWSSSGAASLVRRSDGDYTRFTGGAQGLSVREVMEDGSRGRAVQQYLKGLAEMPVTWPGAAQEAQVVAARSYLVGQWVAAEGGYVVQPTTADQAWQGFDQQQTDSRYGGKLAQAVDRTTSGASGTVLVTASGAVARDLFYASSHGGWSESNTYVWGSAQVSHLRPVDDSRWDAASQNPYRSWSVGLTRAQVATAFGFTSVTNVTVAPRGSAQRTAVVVTGVRAGRSSSVSFTGQQARDRLAGVDRAVRSSGFTIVPRTVAPAEPPVVPVPAPAPSLVGGVPLVGDWDGNGRDEVGLFKDGRIALRLSSGEVRRYAFGRSTDVPVVGDWDGNGVDSVGVFRSGAWFLRNAHSSGGHDVMFTYGGKGDVPIVGKWNGRSLGVGVVASQGRRYLLSNSLGGRVAVDFGWGRPGDRPIVGDWDGNGTVTPGIKRGGARFVLNAWKVAPAAPIVIGRAEHPHIAGDFDGNRTTTLGVLLNGKAFAWRDDLRSGSATTTTTFTG